MTECVSGVRHVHGDVEQRRSPLVVAGLAEAGHNEHSGLVVQFREEGTTPTPGGLFRLR